MDEVHDRQGSVRLMPYLVKSMLQNRKLVETLVHFIDESDVSESQGTLSSDSLNESIKRILQELDVLYSIP